MMSDWDPYQQLLAVIKTNHEMAQAVNNQAQLLEQTTQSVRKLHDTLDDIGVAISRLDIEIQMMKARMADYETGYLATTGSRPPR